MEQDESDQDYIKELENKNREVQGKNVGLSADMSSMASASRSDNLITYQIENSDLLEKLEHFYRGEYIGTIKGGPNEGEKDWIAPEDPSQVPFNEFGVSAMMEIVSKYIDKNTTLSYYSEMRIYEIMADLGDELVLYVLSNYEAMGMSDKFRKTKFRLLIVTTLHMIESTYRKAISGKTIEEINQSRIITQSDSIGIKAPTQNQKRGNFSLLNPRSWGG